jgi:aminodeoxychorismate lyase
VLIFLNGRLVPEESATVSVFDRGFLYGDGLFETMRVYNGRPFRWAQHLERLHHGMEFVKIPPQFSAEELRGFADQLISQNGMPDAVLRLNVSRGIGQRGYSPAGAERPTFVMSLHPATKIESDNPRPWKLMTSSFRLPANEALTRFKTCNKLAQVLARAEADTAGADEALLLNTERSVVDASSSNLFWIEGEAVGTPPVASGALPGVTRAIVFEICQSLGLKTRETNGSLGILYRADGVFLSLSSLGVVEAESLDGRPLKRSPLVGKIQRAYRELVAAES